jgi:outer membrane protein assembly factor BamB
VGILDYRQKNNSVNCLNGKTGDVLWVNDANSSTNFIFVPDGIYVERDGGGGGVTKYDLKGNTVWVNYTWGSGILYMYLIDNQLQVSVYPPKLVGLNVFDGKQVVQYLKGEEAFISTPIDTFINESNSKLKAVLLESGQTKWETKIPGGLRAPPIFLDHVIILRSGDVMGSIYAIDRASGDILWKTEIGVISNIGYSVNHNKIYYLTKEGKLLGSDINTGTESVLVDFTPAPFTTLNEENVGAYNVAFDDTTNILYAIIGDSMQLFAFKENSP